ncbi:hypothetical protein ADUPG1_006169, partial [Aduncisulcus paluster]
MKAFVKNLHILSTQGKIPIDVSTVTTIDGALKVAQKTVANSIDQSHSEASGHSGQYHAHARTTLGDETMTDDLENLKKILVWSIVAQSIGFFFGFFKMVVLCSESCCCAGLFVLVSIPASILILVLYILQIVWFFKITAGNEDLFE